MLLGVRLLWFRGWILWRWLPKWCLRQPACWRRLFFFFFFVGIECQHRQHQCQLFPNLCYDRYDVGQRSCQQSVGSYKHFSNHHCLIEFGPSVQYQYQCQHHEHQRSCQQSVGSYKHFSNYHCFIELDPNVQYQYQYQHHEHQRQQRQFGNRFLD